jgi:endonuclease III
MNALLARPLLDRQMEGSDIAYDIHVRRMFLRTGLADRDDMNHMIDVARKLSPQRPGELDLPARMIGLGWCHPGVPDCPACPLTAFCPKLMERGSTVV